MDADERRALRALEQANPVPRGAAAGCLEEPGARAAHDEIVSSSRPAASRRRMGRARRVAAALAAVGAMAAVAMVALRTPGAVEEPPPGIDLPRAGSTDPVPAPAPTKVAVPDLRGLSYSEARGRLDRLGLGIAAGAKARAPVPGAGPAPAPSTVLEQEPGPPGVLDRGDVVGVGIATPPLPRRRAPTVDLPLLLPGSGTSAVTGRRLRLSALRGQVVVLAFTASWCLPCREIADDLQYLDVGYGARGVAVVAVASDDLAARAREGLRPRGHAFAVASDRDGSTLGAFDGTGLPTTVLIDKAGRVAATIPGPPEREALIALLDALMAESYLPAPESPRRPQLPAFAGPALPRHQVPARLLATTPCAIDPTDVRLLATTDAGRRVYAARGPGGWVLTAVQDPDGLGATGCDRAEAFVAGRRSGGPAFFGQSRPRYLVGIFAERWTTAVAEDGRRAPVMNGVFWFEGGPPLGVVTLRGPNGSRRLPAMG